MTDTPAYIHQKQLDIYNRMTAGERIEVCLIMATEGRRLVKMRIRQTNPDWSEGEVAVATFKRIYRNDFTLEKLDEIAESIRIYHLSN